MANDPLVFTAFHRPASVETLTMFPVGAGSGGQWLAAASVKVLDADSWKGRGAPAAPFPGASSADMRTSPKKLDFLCVFISVGLPTATAIIAARQS